MNKVKYMRFTRLSTLLVICVILLLSGCNLPNRASATEEPSEFITPVPTESILISNQASEATLLPTPTSLPSPTARPEPTPLAGGGATVYFLSDRDNQPNHFDIYAMDLTTRGISRITTNELQKHNLVVSPDGHWGAFVTGDFEAELIFTVDLTQTNPEPVLVTPDMPNSHFPIWSPDSQRLAFEHGHQLGQSTIYTVNPDGSDLKQISNTEDFNIQPVWSPDSQQIGYTKYPNEGMFAGAPSLGYSQAYIANADGSSQKPIGDFEGYREISPHWAFDGENILFMAETTGGLLLSGLFQTDPRGTVTEMLVEGSEQNWYYDTYYVVHSPAGNRMAILAFASFIGNWGVNYKALYSMRPDGSDLVLVHEFLAPDEAVFDSTATSRISIPSWTPDGTSMIVDDNQNLFLVNISTGERTQLTETGRNLSPMIIYDPVTANVEQAVTEVAEATQSDSYPPLDIQGSGVIAYVSDQANPKDYTDTDNEIYIYSLESGETRRVTRNLENEKSLVWSPDGNLLAYIGGEGDQTHLFVLDYEAFLNFGTGPAQITNLPGRVTFPAWSPDSAQFAFVHQPDLETLNSHLFTMSVDGSNLIDRSLAPGIYEMPRWSPSGSQLSFSYSEVQTFQSAPLINKPISFILDLVNNTSSQIPQDEGHSVYGPTWTPDGAATFYWKLSELENDKLAVLNVETGEEFILGTDFPYGGDRWLPMWSPDGNQLAFTLTAWEALSNDYSSSGLYLFSLIGSNEPNLAAQADWFEYGVGIQSQSWSPDGDWLAITGTDVPEGKLGIYLVDTDGNNLRRISDASNNAHSPAWGPVEIFVP